MKRILVAAILASGMIYCPQLSGQTGGELETYAAKYPNEAIIYLKDELHLNIRVDKTGLVISNTANQEKLQLEDRGTFFSKGGIEYSGWSPLDQIQASTLVPDGKKFKTYPVKDFTTNDVMEDDIFYNDTKEVTFYFPELTKGAHLKLDYTLSIQEPRFLPSFYFGNYAPTEHAEYTVTFPENLELEVVYFNTDAEQLHFTQTKEKGNITYSWSMRDIPKLPSDDYSPSLQYYCPHVVVYIKNYISGGKKVDIINNLDDLHNFYSGLLDQTPRGDRSNVQSVVDSITAGLSSDDDKVKNIFNWVQSNIKYVAFEAGLDGFVPRDPAKVCANRFGDCKDMATLTTEMLQMAHINAHVAWVGTRDIRYSYTELPTPACDNHMICVVQKPDSSYLFLDATASYIDYTIPTSFIQEKEALVHLSSDSYKLVKIPAPASEKNYIKENMHLTVEDGLLVGRSFSLYDGYIKMHFKNIFQNVPAADRLKLLEDIYETGNNTFVLDSIREVPTDDNLQPMQVSYGFRIKNYVRQSGNKMYINLTLDKDFSTEKLEPTRVLPYEIPYKHHFERTVSLEIPEGYTVEYLPSDASYENDNYFFTISYTSTGKEITMHSNVGVKALYIMPEEFATWNDMITQLTGKYMENIILKKQ